MKLTATPIAGAYLLDIEPIVDERGFFARSFCADTLRAHGLETTVVQQSISMNTRRGTLRGLHYQTAPHQEVKLVRVTRGRLYDVMLDLRPTSPSHLQWHAVELSASNHRSLYVPKGVAHGFQTLEDDTEVGYQMMQAYTPSHSRGVRWNDPLFGIVWPVPEPVLSMRDRSYLDYSGQMVQKEPA
jgi:dTDP-4-dehydrorhamnose 3,5-epimerase